MDRDSINKRIEALRGDLERLRNTYVATEGALRDCEWWLTQCEPAKNGEDTSAEKLLRWTENPDAPAAS